MFQRIANRQRTNNKVSARYKYVSEKATWIAENTYERFDFMVKKRFKKKQDTMHYVFSFSRILEGKDKEEARKRILDFIDNKFGSEHFYTIAEHEDNGKTHYHILISRNLITNKMLHINIHEFRKLKFELHDRLKDILNDKEKEALLKYKQEISKPGKIKRRLNVYQYKEFREKKGNYPDLLPLPEYYTSRTAFLKDFATKLREAYEDRLINELIDEFKEKKYQVLFDQNEEGKQRYYLFQNGKRLGRLDNLDNFDLKFYNFIEYINNKLSQPQPKQENKTNKPENKEEDKEKALLNEIKENLDLNMLLKYVEDHYNFDTSSYEINPEYNRIRKKGKKVKGKTAIDFLVKDLKLKMAEAFDIIKDLYEKQKERQQPKQEKEQEKEEVEVIKIDINKYKNRGNNLSRAREI